MRLVQLRHSDGDRRVAIVREVVLELLAGFTSIHELAFAALSCEQRLDHFAARQPVETSVIYDAVYEGVSDWRLLPAVDHPHDPARCLITGTGLTHLKSAEKRSSMHLEAERDTDSMRMYQLGRASGRPAAGEVGASPEWFYKGTGDILRAHKEPLSVPPFAEDAGEEAEVAGVYVIDSAGRPRRIGIAAGNEFSDHRLENKNYLYLAASKLRVCSLGPEICVNIPFSNLRGEVKIERAKKMIWRSSLSTGEEHMSHSLANIEHHHFKYPQHRRPGDIHVHFFGADAFSYSEGIELADKDCIEISFEGLGRPLRNEIHLEGGSEGCMSVAPV